MLGCSAWRLALVRKQSEVGPKLQALLDERDHLRVKINLAEHDPNADQELLLLARHRLMEIDRQILQGWEYPNA